MVTTIGAIALLSLLLIGMAREQVWMLFSKPVEFLTRDANGLSPGLPVRLSGFPIGRVDKVELRRDAQVRVTLSIQPAYRSMLGPRSRVRLDQEGLVGMNYLDVTADPSEPAAAETALVVQYESPVDVKDLVVEMAESRIPLNRLLNRTALIADKTLPKTLQEVDRTILAAGELSRSLQRQTELTSGQARQTLQIYRDLGRDGRETLGASGEDLRTLLPLLRDTLKEVRITAQTSQSLMERLSGSWLMPLLEGSHPPAPANRSTTNQPTTARP
jgi:phospholipid/cholesterol/gamma-HCH transport system substrate-binding protein